MHFYYETLSGTDLWMWLDSTAHLVSIVVDLGLNGDEVFSFFRLYGNDYFEMVLDIYANTL